MRMEMKNNINVPLRNRVYIVTGLVSYLVLFSLCAYTFISYIPNIKNEEYQDLRVVNKVMGTVFAVNNLQELQVDFKNIFSSFTDTEEIKVIAIIRDSDKSLIGAVGINTTKNPVDSQNIDRLLQDDKNLIFALSSGSLKGHTLVVSFNNNRISMQHNTYYLTLLALLFYVILLWQGMKHLYKFTVRKLPSNFPYWPVQKNLLYEKIKTTKKQKKFVLVVNLFNLPELDYGERELVKRDAKAILGAVLTNCINAEKDHINSICYPNSINVGFYGFIPTNIDYIGAGWLVQNILNKLVRGGGEMDYRISLYPLLPDHDLSLRRAITISSSIGRNSLALMPHPRQKLDSQPFTPNYEIWRLNERIFGVPDNNGKIIVGVKDGTYKRNLEQRMNLLVRKLKISISQS